MRLARAERLVRRVALELEAVSARVVADARDELDRMRELDEVVARAARERVGLDRGVLLAGEHDDRDLAQRLVRAVLRQQVEAVDRGHLDVLQDHGGAELERDGDRLRRILHAAVLAGALRGDHAAHRLADDGLVVDQQHAVGGLDGVHDGNRSFSGRRRGRAAHSVGGSGGVMQAG